MAAGLPPPTAELAELADTLGLDDAREVARLFLHDAPRLIADLADPRLAESGVPRGQVAAHTLKSTARLVGAHPLAALAAALESAFIAGRPAPGPHELDAVRAEFDRIRTGLAAFAPG